MILKSVLLLLIVCLCCTASARNSNPQQRPHYRPFSSRGRANVDPIEQYKHGLDHEERNPSISPHYGDKEMHQPPASAPQEGRGRNRKGSDNRATMSRENTVVDEYTTSITGQVAVSVSAAFSMAVIAHFLQLMILSQSWSSVVAASAIAAALSIYWQGDFNEFSKSLGVFTILVLKGMSIHRFLPKLIRQVQCCLLLAPRRPFPPGPNPWRYSRDDDYFDPSIPKFSMTNVLLCLLLSGGMFGWILAKPIPLFPTWLGAVGGAAILGYGSTLLDGVGDLLRFLGHTLLSILSFLINIADDVQLRGNTQVMIGNLLFFLRGVDKQYHIMQRLQMILAIVVSKITKILYSMKREQFDREDEPIAPSRKARYGETGQQTSQCDDDDYNFEEFNNRGNY